MAGPSEGEVTDLVGILAGPAKEAFDAMMKVPEVIKQFEESTLAPLRYWGAKSWPGKVSS
jgi:hypothetical protein